jgi:hypothetical protein
MKYMLCLLLFVGCSGGNAPTPAVGEESKTPDAKNDPSSNTSRITNDSRLFEVLENDQNHVKMNDGSIVSNDMYFGYNEYQTIISKKIFFTANDNEFYSYDGEELLKVNITNAKKFLKFKNELYFICRNDINEDYLAKIDINGELELLVNLPSSSNYMRLVKDKIYLVSSSRLYQFNPDNNTLIKTSETQLTTMESIGDSLFIRNRDGISKVDLTTFALTNIGISEDNGSMSKNDNHIFYIDSSTGLFRIKEDGTFTHVDGRRNPYKVITFKGKEYQSSVDVNLNYVRLYEDDIFILETEETPKGNLFLQGVFSEGDTVYLLAESTSSTNNRLIYKSVNGTFVEIKDSGIQDMTKVYTDFDGSYVFKQRRRLNGFEIVDLYKFNPVTEKFELKRTLSKREDDRNA